MNRLKLKKVKVTTYRNPTPYRPARVVLLKADRFVAWKLKGAK